MVARWFAVHVESAPVSLHRVDAASVADISIVHTASVFRATMIRVLVQHIHGVEVWAGAQSGPVRTLHKGKLRNGPC